MKLESSRKNILVVFALLAISVAVISCAFITLNNQKSYADGSTGNLTINGQAGATYDGYMVFSANVVPAATESGHKEDVTNVNWASDAMKEVTLNFIRNTGYTNESDFAPDALYYIKTQIENDGVTTQSIADYFSYKFAKELVQNNKINAEANINSGVQTTLEQGYWLFVSPASLDLDTAATCPIWTSVMSGNKTVREKAASNIPTLTKGIKTAEDGIVNVLDGRVGDEFEYEITGTLPSNFDKFPTYRYIVTDTFSEYLDPVLNVASQLDYKLTDLEGKTYIPDVLTLDTVNNKIEFGFYDLNKVAGISSDTVFIFNYKAKVKDGAISGALNNNAVLTYTSNPVTGALATSNATLNSSANVYMFNLKIHVVDANNEKGTAPGLGLKGAKFGVKIGEEQFVQANGSIGPETHLFESDENGVISIPSICSGTYTFVEEYVPEGYVSQESDVELTISPSFNDYEPIKVGWNMQGGYKKPIFGTKWYNNEMIDIDLTNCVLDARICNLHQSNVLPITGLAGYTAIAIIALVVFAACGFGIYKVRKNLNRNEI